MMQKSKEYRFYSVHIHANCAIVQIEFVCQELGLTIKSPSLETGLEENEHVHVDKKIKILFCL